REHIEAAMPEGMRIGDFYSNIREPIRDVQDERYRTSRQAYPTARTGSRRSSLGWILPLALLALLLGLIWNWANRPRVRAAYDEKTGQVAQMGSLERLRTKYYPVIQEARKQGIQISSITEQDGKLTIRGAAPSVKAANRFKEQIRRINPTMDDVVVDLSIDSS